MRPFFVPLLRVFHGVTLIKMKGTTYLEDQALQGDRTKLPVCAVNYSPVSQHRCPINLWPSGCGRDVVVGVGAVFEGMASVLLNSM